MRDLSKESDKEIAESPAKENRKARRQLKQRVASENVAEKEEKSEIKPENRRSEGDLPLNGSNRRPRRGRMYKNVGNRRPIVSESEKSEKPQKLTKNKRKSSKNFPSTRSVKISSK
jgi:hypothetical protein